MKKLVLATISFIFLVASCKQATDAGNHVESEEHEEHGTEGVVILNQKQEEALGLELGKFQMRNLTTVVKTNGQLEVPPSGRAEVTAVIGGNVKEIKVFEGDRVTKGQVLALLEHPDYISLQEDFAEAVNNLDFLGKEYRRQKELFENNVGAGKDYQRVKSEYNTAKAKYEGLKSRLLLLHISPDNVKNGIITNTISVLSPLNGYVSEVDIKLGKYADAKDKLFEITDNNEVHADFMVYEKDVHLVRKGQKVHFSVSNRPGEDLLATIFAIGKEFEPNTRAVHIHARLDDEPDGNLIPGMYITGHIHTDDLYTRTLPNDAIVTEGTKSYIFILDNAALEAHEHAEEAEGHADIHPGEALAEQAFRMVEIVPGRQDEGYTEVRLLDSLADDTKIVMNAAYYLLADMKKGETEHHH